MSPYTKTRLAFAAIAIALMTMAGGGVFAHTHKATAAFVAMLMVGVGLATVGRRAARAYWENVVLMVDDPYGEETRMYRNTTRGRHLAPKLRRLIGSACAPITILVVGDEYQPGPDGRCPWTEGLREAAATGATIRLFLPEHAEIGKAERAHALAQAHPRCEIIAIRATCADRFRVLSPIVAWSGERNAPSQALLWIESTREAHETTTDAEYRDARNLRRNQGMLEEYAQLIETSAAAENERQNS